jgi:uncharacterized membrane-anchored protein YhcB (DUF1043 family)
VLIAEGGRMMNTEHWPYCVICIAVYLVIGIIIAPLLGRELRKMAKYYPTVMKEDDDE